MCYNFFPTKEFTPFPELRLLKRSPIERDSFNENCFRNIVTDVTAKTYENFYVTTAWPEHNPIIFIGYDSYQYIIKAEN